MRNVLTWLVAALSVVVVSAQDRRPTPPASVRLYVFDGGVLQICR